MAMKNKVEPSPNLPSLKPWMFVSVVRVSDIDLGKLRFLQKLKTCHVTLVKICCKGRLGENGISNNITEEMVPTKNIGSLSIFLTHKKANLNLRCFKSGSIKISGGFPSHYKKNDEFKKYVEKTAYILKDFFGKVISSKICLLNLNFRLDSELCGDLGAIFANLRKRCTKIVEPHFDGYLRSGRKDVYKAYPRTTDKFHLLINESCKGQIIAAKSFEEASSLFNLLIEAAFCPFEL
jgi:hypothetical protein